MPFITPLKFSFRVSIHNCQLVALCFALSNIYPLFNITFVLLFGRIVTELKLESLRCITRFTSHVHSCCGKASGIFGEWPLGLSSMRTRKIWLVFVKRKRAKCKAIRTQTLFLNLHRFEEEISVILAPSRSVMIAVMHSHYSTQFFLIRGMYVNNERYDYEN